MRTNSPRRTYKKKAGSKWSRVTCSGWKLTRISARRTLALSMSTWASISGESWKITIAWMRGAQPKSSSREYYRCLTDQAHSNHQLALSCKTMSLRKSRRGLFPRITAQVTVKFRDKMHVQQKYWVFRGTKALIRSMNSLKENSSACVTV